MDDKQNDKDWKSALSAEQYRVLRDKGTERAFTSPLNDEKRAGVFACAGCGAALFASDHKYESGSGWPSFYAPIDGSALAQTTHRAKVLRQWYSIKFQEKRRCLSIIKPV